MKKILSHCFGASFFILTTGLTQAVAEGRSGEEVYNQGCATCHSIGVANAPKTHDEEAWKARNKDLDALLQGAITGQNAMPPRGACGTCSDDELKAAIEYMIKKAN